MAPSCRTVGRENPFPRSPGTSHSLRRQVRPPSSDRCRNSVGRLTTILASPCGCARAHKPRPSASSSRETGQTSAPILPAHTYEPSSMTPAKRSLRSLRAGARPSRGERRIVGLRPSIALVGGDENGPVTDSVVVVKGRPAEADRQAPVPKVIQDGKRPVDALFLEDYGVLHTGASCPITSRGR